MKHAVIFDIDGTLLDSSADDEVLYKRAIEGVFGEVRFRAGLVDYEHVTDEGILREVLADNGIEVDTAAIDAVKGRFVQSLQAFVAAQGPFVEIPGAKSIISRLGRSGDHAIAIATGSWRQSAELKLGAAGFAIEDVPLATSDDAVRRTDIMRHALHCLSLQGARDAAWRTITYYGDGVWDRAACAELGWTFRAVGPVLQGIGTFDNEYQR